MYSAVRIYNQNCFCGGIVTPVSTKSNYAFSTKFFDKKTALGKQIRFPQGFQMSKGPKYFLFFSLLPPDMDFEFYGISLHLPFLHTLDLEASCPKPTVAVLLPLHPDGFPQIP